MAACRRWLEAEIAAVQPRVIVCLGAVAARALLGNEFRITRQRGEAMPSSGTPFVLATIHPSALLRIGDAAQREAEVQRFIHDLAAAALLARAAA